MDAFSTAYMIAVGLFVAAVWALIIADAIGHYADRAGRAVVRMLARIRDRKVNAAASKWAVLHPGHVDVPDDLPAAARRIRNRPYPRTDRS